MLNACFVDLFRQKLSLNAVFRSSPMSAAPTSDTEKEIKKQKRDEFKTPPRLRQAE